MAQDMKESGYLMRCLAKANFSGQMAEIFRVNLKMELCMVMEFIHGKMVVNMKATIVLIKNMA
jgi:hypothetical protein